MKSLLLAAAALLATAAGVARAAEVSARDPMQPPAVLRPAAGAPAPAEAARVARHLIVVDGQRYVVDGGRRRGVGDLLAGARIESIEDTAVVVRAGGTLERLPLFAGVVKRPAAAAGLPAPADTTEQRASNRSGDTR